MFIKVKKSQQITTFQADISFEDDFKFDLNDTPIKDSLNRVIKNRIILSLKERKTFKEHLEYVKMWVEETVSLLEEETLSIEDTGVLSSRFKQQFSLIFKELI